MGKEKPSKAETKAITTTAKAKLPKPKKEPTTHPLYKGMKEAKLAIAKILQKKRNQQTLEQALQAEFDENPTAWLKRYEPFLRRYEDKSLGTKEKAPLQVNTQVVLSTEREDVKVIGPVIAKEVEVDGGSEAG